MHLSDESESVRQPGRLGCVGISLLVGGTLLLVLTALPALLAGCWGAQLVSTGVVGYGFNCHSQECVDEMGSMALIAMSIVLSQVVVLALVLSNRRRSPVVGAVGATAYVAVALVTALSPLEGLTAYFLLVAVGCALLAIGSAMRRGATDHGPPTRPMGE